jgi:histidine triad (HIT) family protein
MCVFCAITRGEADAHVVLDNDRFLAFLDRRPLFEGHCLLIPKQHHETLADLPDELVGPLFESACRLAGAVELAMDAQGTFLALNNKVSQSVPHVHVHVVPRRRRDGLRGFFWPRRSYHGDDDMRAVAARVSAALASTDPLR